MTTDAELRSALAKAGFEPDFNVCGSCGHHGSRHDLGNWCLDCPRPDTWDRTAKSPTRAKTEAGWCYFGSMSEDEKWAHGIKQLKGILRASTRRVCGCTADTELAAASGCAVCGHRDHSNDGCQALISTSQKEGPVRE